MASLRRGAHSVATKTGALLSMLVLTGFCVVFVRAGSSEFPATQVADITCSAESMEHAVTLSANETFSLTCATQDWEPVPSKFHEVMCPGQGCNGTDAQAAPYVAYFPLTKYWKWVSPENNSDNTHHWTTPVGKWLNMQEAATFSVGCRHKQNKTLCFVDVTVKAGGHVLVPPVAASILALLAASAVQIL
ncbi:UNVERIFIED_CONTAM: SRS domain protein [Hammondia hammondi]|eukprot:XP_008882031.1 SRS domain protein [Hammondia hammondi]